MVSGRHDFLPFAISHSIAAQAGAGMHDAKRRLGHVTGRKLPTRAVVILNPA